MYWKCKSSKNYQIGNFMPDNILGTMVHHGKGYLINCRKLQLISYPAYVMSMNFPVKYISMGLRV